jgi:exonuclease III
MATQQKIRIITWNCRNGPFQEKYALLEALKPDLSIIQEMPNPGKENNEHGIWFPSRLTEKKGVAVISSDELKMTCQPPSPDLPEVFVPIKISGKVAFNLLAVWTQKEMNYVESLEPIFSTYRDFLSQAPSVIAGDFNSNAIWDKINQKFSHSMAVNRLEQDFKIVSAYHKHHNVRHGEEKEKTFYMYYHEDKPFHIDYCFVPNSWNIETVTVGHFAEWCKDKKSDHCPLIVDLQIPDSNQKSEMKLSKPGHDRFCADIEITGSTPIIKSAK